jgi:DNA topoisomerase-3
MAETPKVPPCPQCGSPMAERHGRNGAFYGCTKYPLCRGSVDIPDPDAPDCPKCGEPMRRKMSDRGAFWGCSNFPACDGTRNDKGEARDEDPLPSRRYYRGRLGRGY